MGILEDHQHRALTRQSLDLRNERLQRSLPLLLRGQTERGVAAIVGKRQHIGKQRDVVARRKCLREKGIELIESSPGFIIVRQPGGTFHLANDWIKCAVRVLRAAEIAQARVQLGGEMLHQRCREPRFADASLARQQYNLAFPRLCPGPTPKQQFAFFVPPDQGGHASCVHRLEAALYRTLPQRRPGPRRADDALEVLRAEVLELEKIAEKPSRAVCDDDHIRRCDPLQARREVRCLADNTALLSLS